MELNQNVLKEFTCKLKKHKYAGILDGLKLVYNDDEDCPYIYLEIIKIKKKFRNQGYGSIILNEIVQLADSYNVQIRLYATDIYCMNLTRLYRFYEKHGFVLIKNNDDGNFIHNPGDKKVFI